MSNKTEQLSSFERVTLRYDKRGALVLARASRKSGIIDQIGFQADVGAPIPRLTADRNALLQSNRHQRWAFGEPLPGADP